MKKNLLFSLFLLFVIVVFSSCGLKARLAKADRQFEIGEYYGASDKYKQVSSRIPKQNKELRARVAFSLGECYRILNMPNAEQSYSNAIRFGYPDTVVFLNYAQVLHRNGKYKESAANYAIYQEKYPNSPLAINGLKSFMEMDSILNNASLFTITKSPLFNAKSCQTFSPMFGNQEGDILYFTSNRKLNKKAVVKNSGITGLLNNQIFSAKKNASDKWEKPQPLYDDPELFEFDDGVCSFTADGSVMYFTRSYQSPTGDTGTEIYMRKRAGGEWSNPQKVTIFQDSTISVAHPAISADGTMLYFVSDSPHGFGGKDIWQAEISEGTCSAVKNLGADINTPADEMFPYMSINGTLYFSSNGHPGLGGLDIFSATVDKNGKWTVNNMGVPLNSNSDDFGITFTGDGLRGFFSSNRGERRGYDVIYSFEKLVYEYFIEGQVLDEISVPVPDATVRLVSDNGTNIRVQTRKDGTYKMKVDKDMQCVMMASNRGFLNQGFKISTETEEKGATFTQNFRLPAVFRSVRVDNIFYEFAKWNLTPESETGLNELIKILTDNPSITIELSAHTDYVGNNQFNKTLSERRAKSVVDYLIAAGINAGRLTSTGYGEEKPVVVTAEMAEKYPFLKEDDTLTEEFVLTLTPEEQEIANQINRRTEFKVLKINFALD